MHHLIFSGKEFLFSGIGAVYLMFRMEAVQNEEKYFISITPKINLRPLLKDLPHCCA